jgi:hypothetical protein
VPFLDLDYRVVFTSVHVPTSVDDFGAGWHFKALSNRILCCALLDQHQLTITWNAKSRTG